MIKTPSKEYADNYDAIFKKKQKNTFQDLKDGLCEMKQEANKLIAKLSKDKICLNNNAVYQYIKKESQRKRAMRSGMENN